ncbi:MAG: hypothetical protein GY841_12045 [FCB group bacterium]|nr:hypothetical protein [FCB group bacterium]
MHSQLMGPAANPLDMILGMGGTAPAGQPVGGDEFGSMLDFSMPLNAKSNEGLVAGESIQVPAGIETAGMITVQIPQSMLESLGLHSGSQPSTNLTETGQTEPHLAVPAELLVAGDGKGDTVYLKLQADMIGDKAELNLPDADDNGREMLLPMRLRTVEQIGNRLIADAELQGAAGKDKSIRLRLELAGNTSGNQGLNWSAIEESVDRSATGKPGQMSKMLGDLGVKLIVIENVENGSATTLQSILPEAAPVLKKANGIRIAGQPGANIAVTDSAFSSENGDSVKVDQPLLTNAVVNGLAGEKTGGNKIVSARTGEPIDFGDRLAALSSNPAISTETGLATAVESQATEQKSEPSSVRFYDLDRKLDQLKQNPGQKIRVQLAPAKLGRMELSIASHRGLVTVNLVVESTQTRLAVERNLAQLENRMAASGIKVDSFQVTVNQSSRGESFAGNYSQQQQSGFAGNGQQGDRQKGSFLQNQLHCFETAGVGFDQVLVNCLA